jgi:hypothetical protein
MKLVQLLQLGCRCPILEVAGAAEACFLYRFSRLRKKLKQQRYVHTILIFLCWIDETSLDYISINFNKITTRERSERYNSDSRNLAL